MVVAKEPALVFICDLTYTQQTISSDIMPAAVGCVATYAERELGESVRIELFKFPEALIEALESGARPRAIGFSNYAWNEDLSTQFARVIKANRPEVVTIFGGPNYPTNAREQERFLRGYLLLISWKMLIRIRIAMTPHRAAIIDHHAIIIIIISVGT